MIDIGIGCSLEENSVLAMEEAIHQAKNNLKNKSKIDLGIMFNSYDFSASGVVKTFSALLNDVPLIGATGPVIISPKGILKHGIVIALLGFSEDTCCNTTSTRNISKKNSFASGEEIGKKLLLGFKNISRNLVLLFFDRLINDEPNFIAGLQENLGKSFPCLGTFISGQDDSTHSSLYLNNEILNNSCAGIIWGGRIIFGMGIKHGWKPLGKPHLVSNAVNNIINTIDEKPAEELYKAYLALDRVKLKKHLKKLSVSYPLGIFVPGEEEYLLRNIISIENRGELICQGNIPEGSTIRLMISTQEMCLSAIKQAIEEAQRTIEESLLRQSNTKNSRFAIIFSSISRYNLLRRDIQKELYFIKKALGETPFLGIYTHAELAPLTASNYRGQIYFHNQNFSVLIIEG